MDTTAPDSTAWEIGQAADCDHDELRQLGADGGGNVYRQCGDCGSIVVEATAAEGTATRSDPPVGSSSATLTSMLEIDSAGKPTAERTPGIRDPLAELRSHLRAVLRRIRDR